LKDIKKSYKIKFATVLLKELLEKKLKKLYSWQLQNMLNF